MQLGTRGWNLRLKILFFLLRAGANAESTWRVQACNAVVVSIPPVLRATRGHKNSNLRRHCKWSFGYFYPVLTTFAVVDPKSWRGLTIRRSLDAEWPRFSQSGDEKRWVALRPKFPPWFSLRPIHFQYGYGWTDFIDPCPDFTQRMLRKHIIILL